MHPIFEQYSNRLARQDSTLAHKNFKYAASMVEDAFDGDPFEAEPWEWEEVWATLPFAASTKQVRLKYVRAAINYAQKRGIPVNDPTRLIEIKVPHREPDVLTSAELRRFKADCRTDEQLRLWHGLVYTGMRQHEVAGLRAEHVDFLRQRIRVVGKGDKERIVPMHPELAMVLHGNCRPDKPVFSGAHWKSLGLWAPDTGFHAFRRTVASSLAENDVPDRVIDSILGWSPRTIAGKYYVRISDAKKMEAICRLYQDDPI